MKVAIISGSERARSNSLKVAHYIERVLHTQHRQVEPWILDVATADIPRWTEPGSPEAADAAARWRPFSDALAASDAFVVIAPEWAGMAPPALKNVFVLCEAGEMAHKPGFLVGVSTGLGGTYPIAELRMSSFKNTHVCYIPEQIVLRNAGEMLDDPEAPSSSEDARIRQRLHHGLDVLVAYGQALAAARTEVAINWHRFPFGM